jgi:hypothetical protein
LGWGWQIIFACGKARQASTSFGEHKAAKNFDLFDVTETAAQNREAAQKFFGAFFQKRTALFL